MRHKTVWKPLSSKRHYRELLLPLKSQFRGLLFLYRYPGYRPPILPKLKLQKFCFAAPSVNHGPVVSTSLVNSDNLGLHPIPTKSESASNKMSRCFLSKLVIGRCWAPGQCLPPFPSFGYRLQHTLSTNQLLAEARGTTIHWASTEHHRKRAGRCLMVNIMWQLG